MSPASMASLPTRSSTLVSSRYRSNVARATRLRVSPLSRPLSNVLTIVCCVCPCCLTALSNLAENPTGWIFGPPSPLYSNMPPPPAPTPAQEVAAYDAAQKKGVVSPTPVAETDNQIS